MSGNDHVKRMLVVGDWVVDENWLVTKEDSSVLQHLGVGKQRYCSRKTNMNSQILRPTAAGGVTKFLNTLNDTIGCVDIYGLGFWAPSDTNILAALCRNDKVLAKQTPLSLDGMNERDSDKRGPPLCKKAVEEKCLQCIQCSRLHCLSLDEKSAGTWRILRIYCQNGPSPPELLHRYDWEVTEDIKEKIWTDKGLEKRVKTALDQITESLGRRPPRIDAVVVVDHLKGGVSSELIRAIQGHDLVQGARWYVRTKNYERSSPWIDLVRSSIRLLFLGSMNVDLKHDPWFFGRHLSEEAIKWMIKRAGGVSRKGKNGEHWECKSILAVFHRGNKLTLLMPREMYYMKEATQKRGLALLVTKSSPNEGASTIGQGTVLFSSLVSSLEGLDGDGMKPGILSRESIVASLNRSFFWCKLDESDLNKNRFDDSEDINFGDHFHKMLSQDCDERNAGEYGFQMAEYDLEEEVGSWKDSMNEVGIVDVFRGENSEPSYRKLQIWRGWSLVRGYIAVSEKHKEEIAKLVSAVQEFRNTPYPFRSLSVLILSDPGWGKSYLVERLSQQMDIEYLEFNITQLASIDDLMASFDTISSVQTQKSRKPLVVFWDELNGSIGGVDSVYSYFLGPISNGVYRRRGQTFELKPCVWIFAATGPLSEMESKQKGSDFLSRINGPIINITSAIEHSGNEKLTNLERLYICATLMKRRFPGLLLVEEPILWYLYNIVPKHGVRSLEFVISKFREISHGRLTKNSLPEFESIKLWVQNAHESELLVSEKSARTDLVRLFENPPE